ncbi:MAG: sigma-70 family RNA polymerase sigma factor [Bacteroidetes bacterium]|nr:sigma-70 family RNA polymerase sigma factor [Bacteroidota bacterium]
MRPEKTLSLPTDTEIIDNLTRDGHNRRKAEDQLFNGFIYFVKEGIRKYSLEEEEALDVYSDTIISAIEKITGGLFEGRSSLKTYLFRIFHNKCVDRIRQLTTNKNKIHRNTASPDLLSHLSDSAKSIVQHLVEQADFQLLKERLSELGDSCRKMLGLFADGYSDKEIAVAMEYKTAEVVKTSRLRCLEKLRQSYNLLKH